MRFITVTQMPNHYGASIRSKMFTGKLDDIVPESQLCYAFD